MEKEGFVVTQQIEDWLEGIAPKKRQLLLEVHASHNRVVANVVRPHFGSSHSVYLMLTLPGRGERRRASGPVERLVQWANLTELQSATGRTKKATRHQPSDEVGLDRARQHRHQVLAALAVADP